MNALTALARRPSVWFGNGRATIRLSAADSDDGLSIIEHHHPYGDSPPLHVHRHEDETFFVLTGTLRVRVGAQEMVLRAGDIAVAPRQVPHSYRVESMEGAHFLSICRGGTLETLVVQTGRPATHAGLPEPQDLSLEAASALAMIHAAHGIDIVGPALR